MRKHIVRHSRDLWGGKGEIPSDVNSPVITSWLVKTGRPDTPDTTPKSFGRPEGCIEAFWNWRFFSAVYEIPRRNSQISMSSEFEFSLFARKVAAFKD
jgi:hypothetical protein